MSDTLVQCALPPSVQMALAAIDELDDELARHFASVTRIEPALSRALVSNQANKERAGYRWYKYKEAFSAELVEYLLHGRSHPGAKLLDPFAGSGTALFVAQDLGLDACGIELLPIGMEIMKARLLLREQVGTREHAILERWIMQRPWRTEGPSSPLTVLRITKGAYPPDTQALLERYLGEAEKEDEPARTLLRFAALCVLESISYTRKDGQYLRWDDRSGRRAGRKPFSKGPILAFDDAVTQKLREIVADTAGGDSQLALFRQAHSRGNVTLKEGSCLDLLPGMPAESQDFIFTSPPYCNRYDYTRTYALELALLGVNEKDMVKLRQTMLSATVENRAKDLLAINPEWHTSIMAADQVPLLQAILDYLDAENAERRLNNSGIARMVRGYFYEMACVLQECARVMRPGGTMFMVNDNVRYAGAQISVDMILSRIAETLGLTVEAILVLPIGKGNSSQQMGRHGRRPLRKCIYVWRKEARL